MPVRAFVFLLAGLLAPAGAKSPTSAAPAKTPTPAAPACSTPEYHEFDFWLGDWDIVGTDGKPAGQNRVISVLNGCALQESWTGAKGGHGASLNLYDAASRRWHQSWADDSGGLLLLDGEFRGESMVLVGRRPSQKSPGSVITHRITWTPRGPDRVHQFWEASPNEGRTWQTVFDGTYVRKK